MSTVRTITAILSLPDRESRRGLIALSTAFLTSLLLLAGLASSAHAADRVFWANDGQDLANRISYAELDSDGGGGNLDTDDAPGGHPRGVAIDLAANRVFWTKPGTLPDDGRIHFANLDGTGGVDNFDPLITSPLIPNHPNGAAVYPAQPGNPAAGKLYWANEFGNSISSANLDNTGGGVDLIADAPTTGATVRGPLAPMVDSGSELRPERVYWANVGTPDDPDDVDAISYVNLDGTGSGDVDTGDATVANPHGLALDPETNRMYWANLGIGPENTGQGISYVNLDNSEDAGNLAVEVNSPVGVAVDPVARRIYWANHASNTISWANLDGPGGGDLATGTATLNGARSPALLKAPRGTEAPEITGDSPPDSELTCSQGAWAPDLLASWLYQAPQGDPTYSWTRNDQPIAGATGNTYTPSADGTYRCTVTASNLAGSTSQTSEARVIDATPPGPVTNLTATPGDGQVALSWANPGDADFKDVRVVGTIGAPASDPDGGTNVYEGKATDVDVPDLINGTEYTFTAFTRDGHGNWSQDAQWVKATPVKPVSPPPPPPPGGGSSSGGGSSPPPSGSSAPPAGGSSDTSTPPVAFGATTRLRINVAARRISGRGPVKVVIRNANGFEVSGRLSARASKRGSVSRAFLVDAEAKRSVRLKLSKPLRRLLERDGKLSLRLTAKVKDPAGGNRTVRTKVVLKLRTSA